MKSFSFEFQFQGKQNQRSSLRECLRMLRVNAFAIVNALRVLLATLREIFDENAYARFLSREQAVPSRESYRAFQREMTSRRERRARCC